MQSSMNSSDRLLGLALSYMLWRTGSLWPGIFLHVILNGVFAATVLLA